MLVAIATMVTMAVLLQPQTAECGVPKVRKMKQQQQPTEEEATQWLAYYNDEASKQWNRDAEAWWAYQTNITEYNEQQAVCTPTLFTQF